MIIPHKQLSAEALQILLEGFAAGDAVDSDHDAIATQQKTKQFLTLLNTGDLYIQYDEDTQTCSLVSRADSGILSDNQLSL